MAKSRNANQAPSEPRSRRQRSQWTLSRQLKAKLESHPQWPYLKPSDWHPLARAEWGLQVNIQRSDPRYGLIRNHCNNRISKIKKEQAGVAQA